MSINVPRKKKNIYYKTDDEIELLRASNQLVSKTHAEVAKFIRPGIPTARLDQIAEEFIRDHGAEPAFKGYRDFPATLCISVNEAVVHGIPTAYELQEGDIISIDCGTELKGYFGDSAYTYCVGEVKPEVMKLLKETKESLRLGIEQAKVGKRIGDISFAIQQHARKHGYGVVRELVGHGIGRNLHEEPEVPNYGKRGKGRQLKDGLVIAIEPMINLGRKEVRQASDNWTIITIDKKPSAHYEHTIAVRKTGPDILSSHKYVEEAIKNNPEIREISIKN